MYFDTHVHLNSEQYGDVDEIVNNALENGVNKMVVIGYGLETSLKAIQIAEKYEFIYAAVGMHPSEIKKMNKDDLNKIESLLTNKKVVAIGEIGLDYHWDKDNKEEQKEVFIKQIKWSSKYNLPIIIHSRDSAEDTFNVLKENKKYYKKGIMHCYSYSLELAKEFIKLGFMLAFGGALTFLNAKQNKEVVKEIDSKYLLTETDAPYLTPHPYRGKRNEPKYIHLVVEEMSRLKNINEEEMSQIVYNNACDFFEV